MNSFLKFTNMDNFTIAALDISDIENISKWFPKGGVIDINLAERGMVLSLHGQNTCQEHITKIDIWIGYKESDKNKAWLYAINKAKDAGFSTVKDKEWFAQADDAYIECCNELAIARAAKKYFENKSSNFSGWHYAFKTFLGRDYLLEKLGNSTGNAYNITRDLGSDIHPSEPYNAEVNSENWGEIEDDSIWK